MDVTTCTQAYNGVQSTEHIMEYRVRQWDNHANTVVIWSLVTNDVIRLPSNKLANWMQLQSWVVSMLALIPRPVVLWLTLRPVAL